MAAAVDPRVSWSRIADRQADCSADRVIPMSTGTEDRSSNDLYIKREDLVIEDTISSEYIIRSLMQLDSILL